MEDHHHPRHSVRKPEGQRLEAALRHHAQRFARLRDACEQALPRAGCGRPMITLYDYDLSGNCYKVRLLLALLGLTYQRHPVDFYPGREHKSAWFLALNPLGQLPVLEDDGLVLRDAQAILVYLASMYDSSGRWYPAGEPALLGVLSSWLMFADASRPPRRRPGCMTASSMSSTSSELFRSASPVPRPGRAPVVFRTHRAGLARSRRESDHRRHRRVPLRAAVGGGRHFTARLSGHPPLAGSR